MLFLPTSRSCYETPRRPYPSPAELWRSAARPCLLLAAYRYWFLADTEEARTLITPDVTLELDLDIRIPVHQTRIASVHQVMSAPVVRLASVQIGAQYFTNVEALGLPLPAELRVDGLLGGNVLEHFRTTFEFPQATIVLR